MKCMVYTSKCGKQIVFDDYVDNMIEHDSYWVEMCPHCHNKYKGILGNRVDDGGSACGTCSVYGCENEADYYVDFGENEVEIGNYFEAVEVCPHCDSENVYPMWDVDVKGFVATCNHCGEEILLCDECMHHEDGLNENCNGCDWHRIKCGGKCFRGTTKYKD